MNRFLHGLLLICYTLVVIITILWLAYLGYSYYKLPIEGALRFEHPQYNLLRPGGFIGHGLGVVGTLLMFGGMFAYMLRKRVSWFARWGLLKYWLEVHIFLCSLGYVMVTFHTSFKFGGLISIGYWSLTIVFVSGMIGRFIYILIPRTIEGRELTKKEVLDNKESILITLRQQYHIPEEDLQKMRIAEIKKCLHSRGVNRKESCQALRLIRTEQKLERQINRLDSLHKLFRYWHVIHLPFALIMLIIAVIHIGVVFYFGYTWIFFK